MQTYERHIQQRLGAALQALAFIEQRAAAAPEGRRMNSLLRQCRQLVTDLEHGFALLQEATSENAALRQQVDAASSRAGLLFELSPIPCVVVYETGLISEANAAATRLLNTSVRYLHEKAFDLFLGADRDAFRGWLQQVSRGTGREQREVLLRPREQRPKHLTVMGVPESGGRVALVLIEKDVQTGVDELERAGAEESAGPRAEPESE